MLHLGGECSIAEGFHRIKEAKLNKSETNSLVSQRYFDFYILALGPNPGRSPVCQR